MSGTAERSAKALNTFKNIIRELQKTDKNFTRSSPQYTYISGQMREHGTTQKQWSKATNEVEHVASLYATYLKSTRRLMELQREWRGGERSIEESANLVGLKLPERQ